MNKEIVKKICETLQGRNNGTEISASFSCKPIPFNQENFKPLRGINAEMTFVDGGNIELIGGPHFSIQYVRIASLRLPEKKRSREEGLMLVELKNRKFYARAFGLPYEFSEIPANNATPSGAAGIFRRMAELQCAANIEGPVCLDGSFESGTPNEKELMSGLRQETVCAISKTSRWATNTGAPLLSAIRDMGPEGAWLYFPLFESADYPAETGVARLHRLCRYVFKIEALRGGIEYATSCLAANSQDPVFPGYPYGLVEVDRMARVSEQEKQYFLTRFLSLLENKDQILSFQRCLDAHSILDSIS